MPQMADLCTVQIGVSWIWGFQDLSREGLRNLQLPRHLYTEWDCYRESRG